MRILFATVMILAAAMAGCNRLSFLENDGGAIPRAKFVDTVVALRRAALQSPSPAEFDHQKTQHLSQTGVSEQDLKRFIEVHGSDAGYMSALWDTISAHIDKPPAVKPTKP
jgi:hypothetical protein